eukprot:TRINITY_DN8262_c0_g1_i1.p1 TRINITY_DN8262_c0_g1~~TRINITY_DN8262_c0_g1_i1.p1  ORF type:complete len:149 (-),score=15.20 TRINITY_DN8262_c0_g1_i1:5-451(-)
MHQTCLPSIKSIPVTKDGKQVCQFLVNELYPLQKINQIDFNYQLQRCPYSDSQIQFNNEKKNDSNNAQKSNPNSENLKRSDNNNTCLLYTSDAADDMQCVDLGGRRIIKKKKVCNYHRPYITISNITRTNTYHYEHLRSMTCDDNQSM